MTDELSTLKAQLKQANEKINFLSGFGERRFDDAKRFHDQLARSEQRERELRELMLRVNPFVESALEREMQAPANHQLFQQEARTLMSKWQAALRSAPPSTQDLARQVPAQGIAPALDKDGVAVGLESLPSDSPRPETSGPQDSPSRSKPKPCEVCGGRGEILIQGPCYTGCHVCNETGYPPCPQCGSKEHISCAPPSRASEKENRNE